MLQSDDNKHLKKKEKRRANTQMTHIQVQNYKNRVSYVFF